MSAVEEFMEAALFHKIAILCTMYSSGSLVDVHREEMVLIPLREIGWSVFSKVYPCYQELALVYTVSIRRI